MANADIKRVRLGEVSRVNYGTRIRSKDSTSDNYPVYGGGGKTFGWVDYNRENQCVVSRFAMSEECVRFVSGRFFLNDSGLTVEANATHLQQEYLNWFLLGHQREIYALGRGCAQKNLRVDAFLKMKLPLPPLPSQRRIAAALDKIVEMKRNAEARLRKLDLLVKARFNEMFGSIEVGTAKYPVGNLEDVCSAMSAGKDVPEDHTSELDEAHTIPIYSNGIDKAGLYGYAAVARIQEPSITISGRGTIGWVCRRMSPFVPIIRLVVATPKTELMDIVYLESALRGRCAVNTGTAIPQLPVPTARKIKVIIPPLSLQRSFAAFVEKVEAQKAITRKEIEKIDLLYRAKLQEHFG